MIESREFWRAMSSSEKQLVADECGTNKAYLSQVANGFKTASPELANKIHVATGGAWNRLVLNPSVFEDPIKKKIYKSLG